MAAAMACFQLLTPATAYSNENCSHWGGNGFGSLQECLGQGQERSRERADDARRRGEADRQRARDAGLVADKLDQDKNATVSRYNGGGMTPAQRAQYAHQPYKLQKVYSAKYQELSRYSESNQSKPFPPLPGDNEKLMRFDTTHLREFQENREEEAKKELKQAEQARAAAANFQNFANTAGARNLALNSLPNAATAQVPSLRAAGLDARAGSGAAHGEQAAGQATHTIGKPAMGDQSSISRRIDSLASYPTKLAPGEKRDEKARATAAADGKAIKPQSEADLTADAFEKMNKAKLALEQKLAQGDAGEKQKPKTAVESFLEEVKAPGQSPGAALASLGGGDAEAAVAIPREISEVVAQPAGSSLAAPIELVPRDSIFEQVTRQYRKRQNDLASTKP